LHYYQQCKGENISIKQIDNLSSDNYDLIIDAVLGTGFHGHLKEPICSITKWINSQNALVLAADIPSGVNADNGFIAENAVNADLTVTMGYVKVGMMLQPAKSICGEVVPVDIGFPDLYDKLKGMKFCSSNKDLAFEYLTEPDVATYKHKQGKVLILAGSRGMTGAAILASNSAIRSGAGLVVTFAPFSLSSIYESNIIEGLTISCEDKGVGFFTENNIADVEKYFDWADALLIGPGLGTDKSTLKLIQKVITEFDKPVVIDADALNAFVNDKNLYNKIKSDFVITPHYGELSRLINKDQLDFRENIIDELSKFSKDFNGTLIAKNAPTLIVYDNQVVVNDTGNQGMATGGTGDVLAGVVTSFIAQGIPSQIAAEIGVFVHGIAADLVRKEKGFRGLIASDIIEYLPKVLKIYE
jgi:NAD(P)H-hydrate epimerase